MKYMRMEDAHKRLWKNWKTNEIRTEGELLSVYVNEKRVFEAENKRGFFGSFGFWADHNHWDRMEG